ncbi:MAG: sigma 54-interacting transcriptional regulator [Planctomycetaceae bacterium]|nr:sigma 54-interacting transcriptional regulator [Planctomycetaceae bacterium]
MNSRSRNVLALLGILVVIYSVFVLAFVITSPDLRLRWLVAAPDQVELPQQGVPIWTVEGMEVMGERPEDEDVLLEVAGQPIHTYLDMASVMFDLYLPIEDPSGSHLLSENSDPSELPEDWIAPVVQIHHGPRMAEIRFQSMSEPGQPIHRAFVVIKSLPWSELIPTMIWFVLQLSIFAVAGIAFWNRPFDASTQMFYIVCMFGLGAFVGGFHWWMIGGSPSLNAPFIVMGLFLPAVLLHFFLIYPRPFPFLTHYRKTTLSLIYSPPVIGLAVIGALLQYLRTLNGQFSPDAVDTQLVTHLRNCFHLLSDCVWYYLVLAGFYFLFTVLAIGASRLKAATRIERMQLTVMLLAGCLAILPIGYSIWLAHFARVKFVMGEARIPMLLASLVFQLAFVIGIIRYKLMLTDQILTRGFVYYLSSMGVTVGFACLIAAVSLVALRMKFTLNMFQYLAVVALFIIATLLLLGVRDRMQQSIDRRFYREKYQLDNALRRMQNAVGQFADLGSLAQMMFGVCREVLQVDQAVLYIRDAASSRFVLSASQGKLNAPDDFELSRAELELLHHTGNFQPQPLNPELPSPSLDLKAMDAHIVQAVEMDGDIRGLLVLGEKRNRTAYTAEDYAFLQALSQIANIGLQNLKAQEEMVHLNEEMQSKIERINDQRRQLSLLQAELESLRSGAKIESPSATLDVLSREKLIGHSPAIDNVMRMVSKISRSESSVLIRGESGTGKELLAEILHHNSPRADQPLVKVHCAALSENLLESELFGHVKGAFTGAHQDKQGRFAAADGGTLFLDEIGDISHETQVKLLRVLQTRSFEPVGSSETMHVDVRLVTATHQNLEQLISEGRFREDLYYRLNVISLTLPSLRERPEDLLELSVYFLKQSAERLGKQLRINDDVARAIEVYHWPGNVRQLQNVIERAAVLADSDLITLQDLPREVLNPEQQSPLAQKSVRVGAESHLLSQKSTPRPQEDSRFDAAIGEEGLNEREQLFAALREAKGNKAQAARLLEMPRSTFYSKLKKYTD